LLTRLGIGFDCASQIEISKMLSLGVEPCRIVYANPCKTPSYLRFARQAGVEMMTFDNSDELCKIAQFFPRAKLLLRIVTDDSNASCQLSNKFGAPLSDARALLELAKKLDLSVVGVAFHVGSGSSDPSAFVEAVENTRRVFDEAVDVGLPPMTVLDVGGGFTDETFEATAKVLNSCLDQYFPADQYCNVRIMAEPGRYYVANAFTLAVNVIAKRRVSGQGSGTANAMLYVNDGVYANLNCIIYDHQNPIPRILSTSSGYHYEDDIVYGKGKYEVSVWGPSCDGLDCITKSVMLPMEIDVGDWLYFQDMGAYTLCAGSQFNGFNTSCDVVYVYSAPEAKI
jgi:ornithine decarboxylase